MICRTCHGNGYVRQAKVAVPQRGYLYTDGEIVPCDTCDSQGEIKESREEV